MTQTSDGPAAAVGPEHLARWVAGGQWSALDTWPRLVEALTRATLHAERAWLGAHVLPVYAFTANDPRIAESWVDTAEQAQRAALDLWHTCAWESVRLTSATAIELSYSAVQLLEQLADERAARERLEQQLERERARAERERAERQTAEHDRDEQRRRADEEHRARQHAERAVERLERELAQERERATRADTAQTKTNVRPRKPASRRP